MARIGTPLLAITVVLAAGCSSGDDSVPVGTTTTTTRRVATTDTPTTSSSAVPDDEAAIIGRYEAFWDARFAANEAPVNPDDPALREYATEPQLANVIEETTRNRDDGIAFRRPAQSVSERRVTVISIEGDVARLQDCATTDGIVYRVVDDTVIDDSVATHSLEATMRLADGEWKLASTKLLQQWEGVAGCALAE
jgi:hypothetical protein